MFNLTVQDIIDGYGMEVLYDDDNQLPRLINYVGEGFYSMDDNEVYHFDAVPNIPTYSRIKIVDPDSL